MEIDEDKLTDYLSFDVTMDSLLELWEKLGGLFGIYSPDQMGVADFLVGTYGAEKICELLSAELMSQLVSEDADLRKEAIELMEEMGFQGKIE